MVEPLRTLSDVTKRALDSIGTHNCLLIILPSDDSVNDLLQQIDTELQERYPSDSASDSKAYHLISLGSDRDLLECMFKIYLSPELKYFDGSGIDFKKNLTRYLVFRSMYSTISRDRFIVFHITEYPLRYVFETTMSGESDTVFESISEKQYDSLIREYFKSMNNSGPPSDSGLPYSVYHSLRYLFIDELTHTLPIIPAETVNRHVVVMSWRTYILLNTYNNLWSRQFFEIYDLSDSGIDIMPGTSLKRFLVSLGFPEDIMQQIESFCDKHVVDKFPNTTKSRHCIPPFPSPEWHRCWLDQLRKHNIPSLVEAALRNILLSEGFSTDSINNAISGIKIQYGIDAVRRMFEPADVSGEVIDFILDIMLRGFGYGIE